jgi:2-dehydro-3-deoxyphosphogluconate aldolase/(4S)-4-hydroxy-2-oxoglutarate aldolase
MLGFTVVHLGINAKSEEAARKNAALLNTLFGFSLKDGSSSIFAGDYIEVMKLPHAAGTNGHIAIATNTIVRAQAYLERQGITCDPESIKKTPEGKMNVIFAKDEILGFAWHLIQKK